jgi:hypothetical protein
MPKQITTYTLDELKTINPTAYAAVHERWKEDVDTDPDTPWSEEIRKSITATIEAAGASMTDWQIGPWSPSDITVDVPDRYTEDDELSSESDRDFFWRTVLEPNGYTRNAEGAKRGTIDYATGKPTGKPNDTDGVDFPGHCPFTGYCGDEDALEHVWKRLVAGDSLKAALESLAKVWRQHLEDSIEQQEEEESMEANWGHLYFTFDGREVSA